MKLKVSITCLIALLIVSQLICGTWSLVSASAAVGRGEEGIFRSESNIKFLSENFKVETKLKRNNGGMYNLFKKGFEKRGNNLHTFLHESNPFLMNEPLLSSTFHQERNIQQDFFSVLLKVKDIIKFKTENSELSIQPMAKNVISTRIDLETIQKLMNKDYIEWIGQVDPIFKFDMQDFMSLNEELVELLVQFHESGISEEMKQLIQVLETQFGVSLIRKEKTIMILSVPRRFALGVCYEISKDSAVIWIEPKQEITIFNKFSKSIIDDGSEKRNVVNFGGLTGEGETVTVVDGSFDTNSCFFTDPNVPIPTFKTIEEGMKLTQEQVNSHRKIKAYYALVDNRTIDSDHGSHVAGSVAGNFLSNMKNSENSLVEYSGVAPDAKMVFVQIGCVSPLCISESGERISSKSGGLNPPTDPFNIFKFSTEIAKSKIQTNSWGGGSSYSYYASKTDQYLFENKDTVSLFAAGNSGAKGFYTLSAQSQAKNIITVGASHNSFDARGVQYGNLSNPTEPNVREWITASLKCGSIGNKYQEECNYFTNSSNVADACDESGYCTKGKLAIAYGSCGCAIDGVGFYFCPRCIYPLLARNDIQPNSVTSFSSRGPTKDGRIKPDILAPGDVVISVKSFPTLDDIGTTCSQRTNMKDHVTSKRGTSMATPTMAGLTAIVRQYFRDGYYVDGVKNTKIGFNPSSALVKATMINSAVDLTHVSEDYNLVERFVPRIWNYTRFQGFGKVQIGNVFQFGKTERKLWIARKEYIQNIAQLSHNVETEFDDPVISSSADEHLYYIAPTNANLPMKNVKITLVWTDYPSSPVSRLNIVNNLDLEVNIYRDVIYGNSQLKGLSQENMVRDTINNVEQVWIDSIDHGVVIRIYAEYLFVPQSYSLVVSGDNVQMHLLKE